MKIKTKIALGMVFLFIVILSITGLGLYYLHSLSAVAQNILKNNYETLEYMNNIIKACDQLRDQTLFASEQIEKNLLLQEKNITEPGEKELTHILRITFEDVEHGHISATTIAAIRHAAVDIQELNMTAISNKSTIADQTYGRASTFVIAVATFFSLITFSFIVNFPGYIADPIAKLTAGIKSIAGKNYEERLHFDRNDEFKELAEAFNQMAEKLDEYEHSSLANILFEKKRIEAIINMMTDPVLGLDEQNKVVFANGQSLALLNLHQEKVIGRYAPDIAVENDLMRHLIRNRDGVDKEKSALIKIAVGGKENYFTKENISIQYTPTGEREPRQLGELILLKNITAFKELDLAKTNFIATISHELKTPIASLRMCIKLLNDSRVGALNQEQHSILNTLEEEILRLSSITQELLDLSQAESGNIRLKVQPVEPVDVVQLAVEAVKFQAQRKGISIHFQNPKHLPAVCADAEKTTWVLINLLTNAIRYSPENDVINLSCEQLDGKVKFSVRDNGIGIEKKYLDKIFDRFFQIPGSLHGTGLGLAISKEFIESQGGGIHVASERGKGCTFEFDLPLA